MGAAVRRNSWWIAAVIAVGALAALLVATGHLSFLGIGTSQAAAPAVSQAGTVSEPAAVAVTVAPVTARPVQRTVQIVGTFYGHDEVTITPKVEGRVAKIHRDVGDVVRPGEVLLEVEDIDCRLAVAEAERALELELAKLGLSELPAQALDVYRLPTVLRAVSLEKNALARLERARRAGTGISAEEREQLDTDYRVAQAMHEQMTMEARATLAAARHKQALLETSKQRLLETKVRVPDQSQERLQDVKKLGQNGLLKTEAPVEYAVAQRLVSEGEMVRAFPSVAVFRLVMDRPLKLLATVPERYVGEVKVGQPVDIRAEPYPNEVFQGSVARVNPTVDRASRTFQIEVLVPNDARELKAGGFAKAAIRTREDPRALTIPEEALLTFAGVTKVFVVQDGRAHAVPVKPGVRLEVPAEGKDEHWLEVRGEFSSGSQVVTSGQSQLAEGTPVRLRTAGEAK